ncbi:MAG: potassium channel protein [Flavobacteriaceae bacterium]|nr:MAG: potassium channel protein [Flavobacteriaceae bacterium]
MLIRSKLYRAVLLLITISGIGVFGYSVFWDYSLVDALYMTIITMTTVGFSEVHSLDGNGKLFTIGLIVFSISSYGYAVTVLSEYLASGVIFEQFKRKKVQQRIDKLVGHTVVCGYGRNGKQAVAKLKEFNKPCLVIERDPEIFKELDRLGVPYVEGNATEDESLIQAGISRANSLIAALPSDADNLFIVLSARQINKDCTIISRASKETSISKLRIAGATNIIMPDKLGGDHMASLVVTPDLVEFVQRLTISEEGSTNLEEIAINDLPLEYLNKTIRDLDLRKQTGCSVIGFKKVNLEYIINPAPNTVLVPDTYLIVLGRLKQIQKLQKLF